MRFHRFFALFVFPFLFCPGGLSGAVWASTSSSNALYTVRSIPIDRTAESASQAKKQALTFGKGQAFNRLIKRLVARDQLTRLPTLEPEQILSLIQDFSLRDEKQSLVRYRADLTVRFIPDQVLSFLRQSGVSVTETTSQPVLLLPVWLDNGTALLWEDSNRWRDAWFDLDLGAALVPLIVPLGDLEDLTTLSAQEASEGGEGVWLLADKYGARDVMIATLLTNQTGVIVQSSLSSFERSTAQSQQIFIENQPNPFHSFIAEPAQSNSNEPDLTRLAQDLHHKIQENWILDNRISGTAEQWLAVSVPLSDLADWVTIKDKIDQTAKHSSLRRLSRQHAKLDLFFSGTVDQFSRALAQEGLVLGLTPSNDWVLSREVKNQPTRTPEQLSPLGQPSQYSDTPLSPTVIIE